MFPASSDIRADAIMDWLNEELRFEINSFEPASSDASFRRYFRVKHAGGQHIVMDAPPDKENTEPFIRIAGLLKKMNIHVPAIYQQNLAEGFLLLEDLGSRSFLDQLTLESADILYQSAFDSLFKLQTQSDLAYAQLPEYSADLLQRELEIFQQWFLGELLAIALPAPLKNSLTTTLIDSAQAQPRVCVHRDFHSRNLMVLKRHSPGVIDFQDAVIGPITYDLVSLLRDCYISWPPEQVEQWMQRYYRRLDDAELIDADLDTFRRWFDLMGLQRHLKAVGIFARLNLRDDKSTYLADIPRTMSYIVQISRIYPELADFYQFLQDRVLPIYPDRL
ncbi:phosphotransferase [Methylomarinum sp. Ch1-1]|uniref:Phosphotransferase n=1 Tax=Methylomarinum roseum TaxID=3067653 RepID=A0AAU7NU37_9GAMM